MFNRLAKLRAKLQALPVVAFLREMGRSANVPSVVGDVPMLEQDEHQRSGEEQQDLRVDVEMKTAVDPKNETASSYPDESSATLPIATSYSDESRQALFLFRDKDLTFVALTLCVHYEDKAEAAIARQACVELHEGMRESQRLSSSLPQVGRPMISKSSAAAPKHSSWRGGRYPLPSCNFTDRPPEQLCNAVNLVSGVEGQFLQHLLATKSCCAVGWVTFLMQRHEFLKGVDQQENVGVLAAGGPHKQKQQGAARMSWALGEFMTSWGRHLDQQIKTAKAGLYARMRAKVEEKQEMVGIMLEGGGS